jgi:quercetin dioxygenase-like cupin family protein
MKGKVVRAVADGWEGVESTGYRPGDPPTGVARHTIVGARKEHASDAGPSSEVRYFDLASGKCSRLEKHAHEHYVIVHAGRGYAIVDTTVHEVAPGDVVYVGPWDVHQFLARDNERFGFFCVVDACRDFVQEPSAEDLARIEASPAGAIARPGAVPFPAKR